MSLSEVMFSKVDQVPHTNLFRIINHIAQTKNKNKKLYKMLNCKKANRSFLVHNLGFLSHHQGTEVIKYNKIKLKETTKVGKERHNMTYRRE